MSMDVVSLQRLRAMIVATSKELLGIPYELGGKWNNMDILPISLDCSGLVEGCYQKHGIKLPDGSQNQFEATIPVPSHLLPHIADLAFFGRNGDPKQIYHIGLVFDDKNIIEARAFDGRDWTGKVTLRARDKWESYKNFCGYRMVKEFSNVA